MAMDNAKKTGLVVALGMPPPSKLKKPAPADEGESDQEAQDEADSGGDGGGEMALGTMWDALKAGDKTAAWDAFCDAMQIAKVKGDEPKAEGDSYGGDGE